MSDIKRIDIKEFRERGYLHEVNRLVLHPLGLALEVNLVKERGFTIKLNEESMERLVDIIDKRRGGEADHNESDDAFLDAMLASAVRMNEGDESLGGVWDYRDDPEGMEYGEDLLSTEKALVVAAEWRSRRAPRIDALGFMVQPVPGFALDVVA